MLATTTIFFFCGFRWSVAINDGHYHCRTLMNEKACSITIDCDTGLGQVDPNPGIVLVHPIKEHVTLECKKPPQSARLIIFNEFAGAVSCMPENFELPYDDPEERKPWILNSKP